MTHEKKMALITGASSGIGRALAGCFAEDGYDIILVARSKGKMEAHATELKAKHGITVHVLAADLESNGGPEKLHAEVKGLGLSVTCLANNAGYGTFGEFRDSKLSTELAMMQLNMNALVILTKLFLPDLIANRGALFNTASTAAFQPGPYMAVYYATKAFVLSFSEALGAELEGTGVTVTTLCPGPTSSGFQDKADMGASALVKGKKLPTSEEVAAAGFRAMKRGQRVFIPGVMNWLMVQSVRLTPRRVITSIVKQMSKPS